MRTAALLEQFKAAGTDFSFADSGRKGAKSLPSAGDDEQGNRKLSENAHQLYLKYCRGNQKFSTFYPGVCGRKSANFAPELSYAGVEILEKREFCGKTGDECYLLVRESPKKIKELMGGN